MRVSTKSALVVGVTAACHGSGIGGVHVGEAQAVLGEDPVEQSAGSAVEVFGDDQVVAALEQQQQVGDGRHARGIGEAAGSAIQAGDAVLQGLAGGVAGAAVVVAGALAEAGMPEGGCLVDGNGHRAGPRVPLQSCLNRLCGDVHVIPQYPDTQDKNGNPHPGVGRGLLHPSLSSGTTMVPLDLAPCLFRLVAATSQGQSLGRSR